MFALMKRWLLLKLNSNSDRLTNILLGIVLITILLGALKIIFV